MLNFNDLTKELDSQEIRDCVNKMTVDYFGGVAKMATYTSKQSILDETLGQYKDFGFELIEPDDHLLELWFKDKRIAVYNQTRVTIEIVREGCKNFLANKLAHDHNDCYGEEMRRNG